MEKFRVIIFVEDYDLGTSIVVQNDSYLMDVYKSILAKLKIPLPNKKEAVFSAKGKWTYALGNKLEDLGKFNDDDLIFLSLWEQDY